MKAHLALELSNSLTDDWSSYAISGSESTVVTVVWLEDTPLAVVLLAASNSTIAVVLEMSKQGAVETLSQWKDRGRILLRVREESSDALKELTAHFDASLDTVVSAYASRRLRAGSCACLLAFGEVERALNKLAGTTRVKWVWGQPVAVLARSL